jgi:hypothetical protein
MHISPEIQKFIWVFVVGRIEPCSKTMFYRERQTDRDNEREQQQQNT